MTYRALISFTLFAMYISCNKDESRTCTTCNSDATASFEVCREPDGTASVNGENTGTDYTAYIEALQETGANCGA
ncbi:hypothetical protein [Patiriisocius sp. Uisw_047]|jgi:hypothetical protein|uniref:hypothetical protein n=1 Tax=Patiriisocius sp. Uisw_047 TaxID=3230969 RepID=UPI0039ED0C5E